MPDNKRGQHLKFDGIDPSLEDAAFHPVFIFGCFTGNISRSK
jgi:hypothetical protein